jgi:hypothetical protein
VKKFGLIVLFGLLAIVLLASFASAGPFLEWAEDLFDTKNQDGTDSFDCDRKGVDCDGDAYLEFWFLESNGEVNVNWEGISVNEESWEACQNDNRLVEYEDEPQHNENSQCDKGIDYCYQPYNYDVQEKNAVYEFGDSNDWTEHLDYCSDDVLVEYSCDGQSLITDAIDCVKKGFYACDDGACVDVTVVTENVDPEVKEEDLEINLDKMAATVVTSRAGEVTISNEGEIGEEATVAEEDSEISFVTLLVASSPIVFGDKQVEEDVCSDGKDNDGDGKIDARSACYSSRDDTIYYYCEEKGLSSLECFQECQESRGYLFLSDPGCNLGIGKEESECSDGVDNDGDGFVDFIGGCDVDSDSKIDQVCGCDLNKDDYLEYNELKIKNEDCSNSWGCMNKPTARGSNFEIVANECEGEYYLGDPKCGSGADPSESNKKGLSSAPEEQKSVFKKFINFIFGTA